MITSLTLTAGQTDVETDAAKKFVVFMEHAQNAADWVLMSPGAALPVIRAVSGTASYQDNPVIKAFGDLPAQLIAQYPNMQAFGSVGDKNFSRMGDITGSGALNAMVNSVTVGNRDVQATLEQSQKRIEELATH